MNTGWMQVPGVRLCGSEAEVEIKPAEAKGAIDIILTVDGRLVRRHVCSMDFLIEKVFWATAAERVNT